ncbi:hypothetical protein BC332_03614 [Capsicum chinense]|nr:hypothetical protein BC332_03614 [Capsicum chinense]
MKKNKNRKTNMVKRRVKKMSRQFFKIILFPHSSKLHIPDEFVMKYGADLRDLVFLEVPTGAIWEVKLQNSNGMKWLKEGWNKFKEYYSIGCGYFLLFQYKGNSHFSVFIFDLSASEIEYPSGPNEDITPEKFVNLVGDASHRKKTQKNACDDDFLRNKTAKVADRSYSEREKSHSKQKTITSLDASICRYPLRSKQVKDVKTENGGVEEHCSKIPVVDPSVIKKTTTNQHSKQKTTTSLDASICRYPLRSKQVKDVKTEIGDVEEHCSKIPVVDPLVIKKTTTNQHHEKKTSVSLDTSHCRYPLRSQQLKEVKLGKPNAEEDLLSVAQKAKMKKANNVKLEKGDVEECNKEMPVGDPSTTKKKTTNRHHQKKTSFSLDTSHCRYPLRSKQLDEVKLGQWEAGGNIHNKLPKKTVAADSSYCKTQNSGLPAPSRSCKPIRVKLEKPDNLFCAAEKAEGKETINVKLETGDMEGNLNSASYKGADSTASEMTRLGKKKMLPSEKHNWGNYCNPHFIVSMQPAYVSQNFQLDIPVNFFKKYIREEETIINLRVSNGRIWRAKLFNIQSSCVKIQASGWRDFVLGNSLKEHDTCVFELFEDTEPVLDVTIFRAMTPAS